MGDNRSNVNRLPQFPPFDLFPPLDDLGPEEFEVLVKSWFEKVGHAMESVEVAHLETLPGADGEYTFDVTVRFNAFRGHSFSCLSSARNTSTQSNVKSSSYCMIVFGRLVVTRALWLLPRHSNLGPLNMPENMALLLSKW